MKHIWINDDDHWYKNFQLFAADREIQPSNGIIKYTNIRLINNIDFPGTIIEIKDVETKNFDILEIQQQIEKQIDELDKKK